MAARDDDQPLSIGQRITTIASSIIGSWWMIAAQTVIIGAWLLLNVVPNSLTKPWDNERFDLLRLVLGLQSVYTAPLILMAQRRLGAKDRKVLYEIDDFEHQAMERRIKLEEKIDRLLSEKRL